MTEYRYRELSRTLKDALNTMPVVVITGMRQVGKSTLLQSSDFLQSYRYYTLDDFAVLEAAKNRPESLLENKQPVIIDEVQKCPELLTAIKRFVDNDRTPGRFILSGSANFSLLRGVSESLAGRALYLVLDPFSRRENTGDLTEPPTLSQFIDNPENLTQGNASSISPDEILRGGMPPVSLYPETNAMLWFKGYEQTYLERDVRELSQVADLIVFRNFIRLAALRNGQILKISELGRDAKLNSTTASRYLGLLETSFLIRKIPPWLSSPSTRLIKSPKLYFTDSGLACHMCGIKDFGKDLSEPLYGPMLETFVAQNMAAILATSIPEAELFFWNIQGRHEVDFVIRAGRKIIAVEVKAAGRWREKDLAGLRAFLKAHPDTHAAIIAYNGTDAFRIDEKLWAIPLGLLIS